MMMESNQEVVVEQPAIVSEAPTIDPVEEAAMKFTNLLPYVKKLGSALNGNGVVRVLHAFAEFPLGANKPRLLNDAERQMFHLLQDLQGYKSTVIQSIMKKNMEMEVMEQELRRKTDEDLKAAELPAVETGE
jgi:hypothetical protein